LFATFTSSFVAGGSADADMGTLPPPGIPKWWGAYQDPLRANCKLNIAMSEDGLEARITGYEGDPDCQSLGYKKIPFNLTGTIKSRMSEEMTIDFSSKGGFKDVRVEYEGNGIRLPTGTKWFKIGKIDEMGYKPVNMTLYGPGDGVAWKWR